MNKISPEVTDNVLYAVTVGVKAILAAAKVVPIIRDAAEAAEKLLTVLEKYKCNKEAARKLKQRLEYTSELLFEESDGLLIVAQSNPDRKLLSSFVDKLKRAFDDATFRVKVFAEKGFLMKLLSGDTPKQLFDDIDKDITHIIEGIQVSLQTSIFVKACQTYKLVTKIPGVSSPEDLNEIQADPGAIQKIAQQIGSDVATFKEEITETLARIEKKVDNIDNNVHHIDSNISQMQLDLSELTHKIDNINRIKAAGGNYDQILLAQLQLMQQNQLQAQQMQALQSQQMADRNVFEQALLKPKKYRKERYIGPITLLLCLMGCYCSLCLPCDERTVVE